EPVWVDVSAQEAVLRDRDLELLDPSHAAIRVDTRDRAETVRVALADVVHPPVGDFPLSTARGEQEGHFDARRIHARQHFLDVYADGALLFDADALPEVAQMIRIHLEVLPFPDVDHRINGWREPAALGYHADPWGTIKMLAYL